MRTIGQPQFTDATARGAYAVLSTATGTATELAEMRRLADQAKGETKAQINNLIEAFIVEFGFPDSTREP